MIKLPRSQFKNQKGMALVGVILALVILSILVPALIRRTRMEAKDTQSEVDKGVAMHLAEAGQDRGAWKLRESDGIFQDALVGTPISGYNDDVEYTDVNGGSYKIYFSSGPASNQVTILSKGRSGNSSSLRAIEAVYSTDAADEIPALSVNSALNWKPNMKVHWGAVITYGSISSSPGYYYPRKYSAGQIVGRDTVDDATNGAMPSNDWVSYDYASFYDLGSPPTINLDYYKTAAKALTGIPAMQNANQVPAGSGYFVPTTPQGLTIKHTSNPFDYIYTCPTCVFYVEGNVKSWPSKAELILEAMIITGDTDFNADSISMTATIPNEASLEYQHSSLGTYFTDQGWVDGGTTALTGIGMYGFLYVGGDMNNAGGGAILVGAMYLAGSMNVNTFTVYYDASVAGNIQTSSTGTISRESWNEITTSW